MRLCTREEWDRYCDRRRGRWDPLIRRSKSGSSHFHPSRGSKAVELSVQQSERHVGAVLATPPAARIFRDWMWQRGLSRNLTGTCGKHE